MLSGASGQQQIFYLLSCGLFNLSSNTLIYLPKYNIIGIAQHC